jgi:Holliday junction resolvasome RuvABC endonuclease subunit
MKKSFLGIDPGVTGGLALVSGGTLTCWEMPLTKIEERQRQSIDGRAFRQIIRELNPIRDHLIVTVEDVWALPNRNAKASFTFGHSLGVVTGIFAMMDFEVQWLTPQEWLKANQLYGKKEACRDQAIQRLFPGMRIEHEGIRDAILIANAAMVLHVT